MAGDELTSTRSPRAKAVRRLAKRTFRDRERRFIAEGPQAVREALGRPGTVTALYATVGAEVRHADVLALANATSVPVHRVSGEVMSELAQTVTPQGVLAVCEFIDVPLERLLAAQPRLVVVLAHVRDPGNAGTVLRTADAVGADGVMFTDASVDPYNGKCVRASAGSLFHLPIVFGSRIAALTGPLRAAGMRVLAADGAAPGTLDGEIDSGALARPTAWIFGNEAWGLRPEVLEHADAAIGVPIYGAAESLNLATAAAVCLYASARALRSAGSDR